MEKKLIVSIPVDIPARVGETINALVELGLEEDFDAFCRKAMQKQVERDLPYLEDIQKFTRKAKQKQEKIKKEREKKRLENPKIDTDHTIEELLEILKGDN